MLFNAGLAKYLIAASYLSPPPLPPFWSALSRRWWNC